MKELGGHVIREPELEALNTFYENWGCDLDEIVEEGHVSVAGHKGSTPVLDARLLPKNHIILDNGYVTQLSHSLESGALWGIDDVCENLRVPGTFKKLRSLNVRDSGYMTIEIPDTLTALEQVDCGMNPLDKLVLPANAKGMKRIIADFCDIKSLTVPGTYHALRELIINDNGMTRLDVPGDVKLDRVLCYGNHFVREDPALMKRLRNQSASVEETPPRGYRP